MPFYEYRCRECGNTLTRLQSFHDAPLTTCPKCHAEALVKLVSASNCALHGVGVFGKSSNPFSLETPKVTPPTSSSAETAKSST